MKAIMLEAGQGRRLLPLTENDPKCLLPVDRDRPPIELQLRAIASCGIPRATVMVGFGADRVERFLAKRPIQGLKVETIFNPFYPVSDNLATCWMARPAMNEDFVLLNGDTLFEADLLRRVLKIASAPVSVTVDHKHEYDDDDMKVSIDPEGRLLAVGKKLRPETVNGESIGMLLFRGSGVKAFRDALDQTMRGPDGLRSWFLSVINEMAQRMTVGTVSIKGLWWQEIDYPEDLDKARAAYLARSSDRAPTTRAASPPPPSESI